MRTLALATVSGAALLAAGSLAPAATGGSAYRPDAFTPVRKARPAPVHLTPVAHARPVPDDGPTSPPPAASAGAGAIGAADLLAKVSSCKPISNGSYRTDEGASPSVPVCGLNGAVFWKADLDIDCDGQVTKACNVDTDPWFQGDTAFHTSGDRPLNAEELPYVVVPSRSSLWDFSSAGIKGGSVVAVVYAGKVEYAVVGDTGPAGIIGEASYATAEALGIDPDPKAGGTGSGVTYILFKDSVASPIESHSAAVTAGEALAGEFLRNN
ncbi:glycoside hydrolase family 75 protein [Streptomyces sp. NBC_01013]|uniref:glycoside hydrolase family 75 protein n=1 Tax=Streptomyces sp. NBC_01013 TaxID=2903718 RepID=UPI003866573D|nr:glycoside hydrolase family 75 protein [Streptomyces sp. NBC_01013]